MYQIKINRLVEDQDFKKISTVDRQKIVRAIYKKLTLAPERYGKPLLRELKGLYRLRISDYRAVYSINRGEVVVYVIKVGLRKDFIVYAEAARRLKLIG
ncbi:type II toxin-antitoxin system RelE/ParE family toxin [Patescibacteria group bacterium]|nr:type II toxin-antitoxin system RelE/ParE family toxin [Patescibacteria group bacterium]MBU1953402.1 type II toxin-antitoxin system RelE/ParE family toxin [Patescibacteria group bacterium]